MKKRSRLTVTPGVLAVLVAAAVALAAPAAEARLIDLHAGLTGGGITGWGQTSGTPDFFDRRKGGGFGAELGVKLLVFDVSATFFQFLDGGGRAGTLEQLLLGVNIDVPVGNQRFQEGVERGKSRNLIRPLANIGIATGTPEPVHLPLDNAQISSKGVVSYWGAGFEHFLNEFMGVGGELEFGYHYFIDGGRSMVAANQTHSSGYQLAGFATFTFHLGY